MSKLNDIINSVTTSTAESKVTTAAAVGRVVAYLKAQPEAWAVFAGEDAAAIATRLDAHLASLRKTRAAARELTPAQRNADRAVDALCTALASGEVGDCVTVAEAAAWISRHATYACGAKVSADGSACTTQKAASILKRGADAGKLRRLVVGKGVYYALAE